MQRVNRKRFLQKISAVVLAAAMLLSVSVIAQGQGRQIQAANEESSALKAYKKFLSKSKVDVKQGTELEMDKVSFIVLDLNHDGISELILETSQQYGLACDHILFTYYNGKVKQVLNTDHGGLISYPKGRIFESTHTNRGNQFNQVLTISKGKCKVLATYKDDSAAVGDDKATIECKIGKKKVSRKKYKAYLKKITKGSKGKDLHSGFREVTDANVKKYVK